MGLLVFVIWPLIQSFYFSLNDIRLRPTGRVMNFVGLNNYRDVWLKDMFFIERLLAFIISTILRTPVIVVFALIIALLINGKIRFKGAFRVVFFLPVVVASGPVMNELINQGATTIPAMNQALIMNILNTLLPPFIAEPIGALFAQIIIILWYSGVQMLIFLASLQKVDPTLYEAAKIDGGSGWECFWKITIPTIKPMILLNAVYTVVSLANSDQNDVIQLIYSNMFAAMRGYGFASAMAWMYAIVVSFILIIVFVLLRERKDKVQAVKMKGGIYR
jgi:ABC-type sugar transport system permease subunit